MDNDIGAAFDKLDRLLEAAQDAGPSIALLMEAGRQQGLGDQTMLRHLRLNSTTARWVMKLAADATTDRSIDLEAADDDLAELVLRWARS